MSILYCRFAVASHPVRERAPVLERLLSGASRETGDPDWRTEAFAVIRSAADCVPAAAAAAFDAAVGAGAAVARGAWVCIASPVHLVAGMSDVTLPEDGLLALGSGEAEWLASDFKQVFGEDQARLVAVRGDTLLCVFDRPLDLVLCDPEGVAGGAIDAAQAAGADGAVVRRLMSEMEMWLFDHALNRARAARGEPPITGLWLWGGGPVGSGQRRVHGFTAGRDPLFASFGNQAAWPGTGGSGVLVCAAQPGRAQWATVEEQWLAPAATALRERRIEQVMLSVGTWRFHVKAGVAWRLWRRARPWWEFFDA